MRALAPWLLLTAVACATPTAKAPKEEARPAGVPGEAFSLSRASVFASPTPPPWVDEARDPGEAPSVEPAYPGGPPVIPHAIADFLPITREENGCLNCHEVEEEAEGEPKPLPDSHYTDLRHAPGERGEEVAGARWQCTACHAARTDAKPLVGSRFKTP